MRNKVCINCKYRRNNYSEHPCKICSELYEFRIINFYLFNIVIRNKCRFIKK